MLHSRRTVGFGEGDNELSLLTHAHAEVGGVEYDQCL